MHQERVQRDMEAQRGWMQILRPRLSILKFRLPWNQGTGITWYPSGIVHLPVYGKHFTHEARLIVSRDTYDIPYNNTLYEGQMAYFNQVIRPTLYHSQLCILKTLGLEPCKKSHEWGEPGGYRCYDCTAFQTIVGEYLLQAGVLQQQDMDYEMVKSECLQIEERLNYFYHVWRVMQATAHLL